MAVGSGQASRRNPRYASAGRGNPSGRLPNGLQPTCHARRLNLDLGPLSGREEAHHRIGSLLRFSGHQHALESASAAAPGRPIPQEAHVHSDPCQPAHQRLVGGDDGER